MSLIKVGDIVEPIDKNRPLFDNNKTYKSAVVCSVLPFILVSECTDMRWNKREQHQFKVVGTALPEVLKKCLNRLRRDNRISLIK